MSASAEKLLNEAQYALQRIHSGESRENRSNASRARSLCKKIIRKFPASTEASSARAILRRLGDVAYEPLPAARRRHTSEHQPVSAPASQPGGHQADDSESPDWNALLTKVFNQPSASVFVVGFIIFVLFSMFGSLLLIPLFAFVLILGPFKSLLQQGQRRKVNEWIAKFNAWVRE